MTKKIAAMAIATVLCGILFPCVASGQGDPKQTGNASDPAGVLCDEAKARPNDDKAKKPPFSALSEPISFNNTLVFNHLRLTVEHNRPRVLQVDDGGYFQIIFACTAPAFFTYTITGDPEPKPGSATSAVGNESVPAPKRLASTGVTMRHDSRFLRYRVSAKLRDGLAPPVAGGAAPATPQPLSTTKPGDLQSLKQFTPTGPEAEQPQRLYSVEFDVWVRTSPEWKLGVIGGVALSRLVDDKFFIEPTDDGKGTFKEDSDARSQLAGDVMALANIYYSKVRLRSINLGMAFGIGTSGTSPRYFIGPSVVFGRYFVLTGGLAAGSVATAPVGQDPGKAPINGSNTLNTLSSRFMVQPFFGIGFTWIDRRDQFLAAFTSSASASGLVGSCVTSVTPAEVKFNEKGEPDPAVVTVDAGADCFWSATLRAGAAGGFEVVRGGSAKGKQTITLKARAADANNARPDVLDVVGPFGSAAKSVTLSQAPASCVTSIEDGKEVDFGGQAGKRSIRITAAEGCDWSATIEERDTAFIVEPRVKDEMVVRVTPPAQNTKDQIATLSVVGPAGAAPKTISLKQPKKD